MDFDILWIEKLKS